jgi:hypothetical protein
MEFKGPGILLHTKAVNISSHMNTYTSICPIRAANPALPFSSEDADFVCIKFVSWNISTGTWALVAAEFRGGASLARGAFP